MAPPLQSTTYCTEQDIQHLLSVDGEFLSEDDNGDGVLDAFEQAHVPMAINYATSRCNLYLQPLYDPSDLATNWLVNYYATILAAAWLRSRRGNPVPTSLAEMVKETITDLKDIKQLNLQLPDSALRHVAWPAWSNVRVDPRYRVKQIRVERPISEPTPTEYSQNVDWTSEFFFEGP